MGEVIREWTSLNGLRIAKVRVPIGVVGIIYESRPNVTSDAAVLCTKTGNATILRGGSEAIHSNIAIAEALQQGGARAGLPADSVLLIPRTDREAVRLMAEMDRYIDLIVPRGGKALIEAVVDAARMPVIKHSDGICIVYVDREADLDMAVDIVTNAKTQRPGVCNAIETVLVHRAVAPEFLRKLAPRFAEKKVELRADETAFAELATLRYQPLQHATEADWSTEYLDLILALRVIDSPNEAIAHVGQFGSHHSDCIVTRDRSDGGAVPPRGRFRDRLLERLDPLYRRRRIRFRRRDRHQHGQTSCPRPDGPRGIDDLQIRHPWLWPGATYMASACASSRLRLQFTPRPMFDGQRWLPIPCATPSSASRASRDGPAESRPARPRTPSMTLDAINATGSLGLT